MSKSRYKPWRQKIIAMLPHEYNLMLEALENKHGCASRVAKSRKFGLFYAEVDDDRVWLETVGERVLSKEPLRPWKIDDSEEEALCVIEDTPDGMCVIVVGQPTATRAEATAVEWDLARRIVEAHNRNL